MEKGEEYNDESYTIAFIQTKVLDWTRTETLNSQTILRQFSDNYLDKNSNGLKEESLDLSI